jgi:hypothetical protein
MIWGNKPVTAPFGREEDRMETAAECLDLARPCTKMDASCAVESCFWTAWLLGKLFKHGCKETITGMHSGNGAQVLAADQRVEVFPVEFAGVAQLV